MGLSVQLAKRWKDSDRDDFLDDLGLENEGDLHVQKLKSPPAQQVRKGGRAGGGEGKSEGTERRGWGYMGGGPDPKALLIPTLLLRLLPVGPRLSGDSSFCRSLETKRSKGSPMRAQA